MATLKVKKLKEYEYFYWCKRVRSHKKFGGDGRVRSIDLLVGTSLAGQWLAYYLWSGEAKLQEYVEAVIKRLCPAEWAAIVLVSIDWRKHKISIKSKHPWFADCRSRHWQTQRKALQSWLDRIIGDSTVIDRLIQHAGYLLGEHCRCSKAMEELREKAREARLYPDNFAPNAEEILDECAHANQCRADQAMEYYLEHVESLSKLAPPKQRQQFRHQVISKAQRLAQDQGWLNNYQAKLESS
jgi:hypothetical protein